MSKYYADTAGYRTQSGIMDWTNKLAAAINTGTATYTAEQKAAADAKKAEDLRTLCASSLPSWMKPAACKVAAPSVKQKSGGFPIIYIAGAGLLAFVLLRKKR